MHVLYQYYKQGILFFVLKATRVRTLNGTYSQQCVLLNQVNT
jgi:hypothetical protein